MDEPAVEQKISDINFTMVVNTKQTQCNVSKLASPLAHPHLNVLSSCTACVSSEAIASISISLAASKIL